MAAGTPAQRRRARAEAREKRYLERKARLEGDPHIDPRRRDLYLDRTLVTTAELAEMMGLASKHRIYMSRAGRRPDEDDRLEIRVPPHPSAFMDIDVWNAKGMQVERGRALEWAEKVRNYVLDLNTGELVKGRIRHGRARADRGTKSRQQVPGTPRKPKQRKSDDDD